MPGGGTSLNRQKIKNFGHARACIVLQKIARVPENCLKKSIGAKPRKIDKIVSKNTSLTKISLMFDNMVPHCLNTEIIKNSFEYNSRRTESIDTLELQQNKDLSRSNLPYTKKEESVSIVVR